MKNLITAAILCLSAACASAPTSIPMVAPVVSTIERVLERHDLYVGTDPELSAAEADAALAESAFIRPLLGLAEVPNSILEPSLGPVLDRHDSYVSGALDLDELEREIYLADTERLRGILAAVPSEVLLAP